MRVRLVAITIAVSVFVLLQFFRPARNISAVKASGSFETLFQPPGTVAHLLRAACGDCHSNNTRYPFYSTIQPLGWWLNTHIVNGKAALNLDEFSNYSARRRISKLKMMEEQLRTGKMPPRNYTWLHPSARISTANSALVTQWLNATIDSLALQ